MLKRIRAGAASAAMKIARRLPALVVDALGLAGAIAVGYGAWLVYVPAGFIVGGMMALAAAWAINGRGRADREES